MIWSFNPTLVLVLLSWCVSGAWVSLPIALLSGIVLLSSSIVVNLLALLSLHLMAYLQAVVQSKKGALVLTKKAYFLRLLGCFVSIYGVASDGVPGASLWIFFGLLISLPVLPWCLGFARHYHSLTSRAYLDTVVLPALVTLVVMSRIKEQVRMDYDQVWDFALCAVGVSTYLIAAIFAGFNRRTQWTIIHLTQSWLGLGLFILVLGTGEVSITLLGALLGAVVLGFRFLNLGSRTEGNYHAVARVAILGIPGGLSFLVFKQALPGVVAMNPLWIILVCVAQGFQAYALIQGARVESTKWDKPSPRLLWVILAQIFLFVGLWK